MPQKGHLWSTNIAIRCRLEPWERHPRIAERDRQKRQVLELKGGQKAAAQQAAEEARQNEKRRMQEQRARRDVDGMQSLNRSKASKIFYGFFNGIFWICVNLNLNLNQISYFI